MEDLALGKDSMLHQGPALKKQTYPLRPAAVAEVDQVCLVNIMIGTAVMVWPLDGGLSGD